MRRGRKKGVITPFAAMSLILIISLILVLLEGARINYGEVLCQQQAQYAAQSFMGQYHVKLLEDYGIYGIDSCLYEEKESLLTMMGTFQTGEMGTSFLNPTNTELENFQYRLLTDDGGRDFRQQAVQAYLYQMPQELLKLLQDKFSKVSGLGNEEDEETIIDEAEKALQEAEELLKEQEAGGTTHSLGRQTPGVNVMTEIQIPDEESETVENPIEEMKTQKESFVLSMVLPEDYDLSQRVRRKEKRLEDLDITQGTMSGEENTLLEDRLIFPLYLSDKFTNALSQNEEEEATNGLKYQMEYFLVGKDSDTENLEGVVNRLILIREMTWLAYRLTDGTSWSQARSIATALMSGIGMSALIEPVAIGIMLAWSYSDAVKDVEELMKGNDVLLVPGVTNETASEEGERNKGLTIGYEEYVFMLLALENPETVAFRALDIIEEELSQDGETFSANSMITGVEGTMVYRYDALFSQWVFVLNKTVFPLNISGKFEEVYCR